jgi:hypothetical protein
VPPIFWLNTSAATALAISSRSTTKVSVANAQSRSLTYCTVDTTTRASGVASSTMMPAFNKNPATPPSPRTSDRSSPTARHAELTITPPRSTMPIRRSSFIARLAGTSSRKR